MGEQRALRWADVDFEARIMSIRRSAPKWLVAEKSPKSNCHRRVDLTAELAEALEKIRHGGELVFCNPDGSKLRPGQFHEILWAAQRKSGLRRIKWYELRHSFASILTTGAAPLRIVQSLPGHSTIRMTERYAHLTVLATPSIHRNRDGSRGPAVVVMEAAEHWNRHDRAGVVVVHRAARNSLPNTLMRSGTVEIADILSGYIFEVLVVEEEHVIEGLAPQVADKTGFMFGARTAVLITRVPAPWATRSKVAVRPPGPGDAAATLAPGERESPYRLRVGRPDVAPDLVVDRPLQRRLEVGWQKRGSRIPLCPRRDLDEIGDGVHARGLADSTGLYMVAATVPRADVKPK